MFRNNKKLKMGENKIKPGYKKTSIGIIPEDWEEMRLEQVSKIIMGVSPNSENYNFEGQGKFLIQGNADIRNRKSAPRQYTSEITKECQVGDILMSVRAPVGEIAKSIHNACIGRGVCAIRNNKKADGEFLFYYLLNTEVLWSRFKQGSTFESVNSTDIRNFTIQIPPIQEQKAIADCLTTWDKGIEKLTQLIASKKEQKKGLMQQLLTGKKRLEGFEKGWKEVRLGDLGTFRTSSVNKKIEETETKVWLLNYMDVYRNTHITSEIEFQQTSAKDSQIESSSLKLGDILFTPSSETPDDIGHSAVVTENLDNVVFSYHLVRFRVKKNLLDIDFSGYVFNKSDILNEFSRRATGSTRYTLSLKDFNEVSTRLPALNEQKAIANILYMADKEIELLEKKLVQFKTQKKGLMQVLLTGERRLVRYNRN